MNFVCSTLRPIDPTLREVIVECASANKIQLNMKLGNEMLLELPFYVRESDDEDSEDEAEE